MVTLFYDPAFVVNHANRNLELDFSLEFATCMDNQLTIYFISKTGINPGKEVAAILPLINDLFEFEEGAISKFNAKIYINHNTNPIYVYWKSKSDRIYKTDDRDVDCNDIEFWFEGLDPLLYHKQLYPKTTLSFKIKDLSYELIINRLNINGEILLVVNEENTNVISSINGQVTTWINDFNSKSMKMDRKYGVVHNFKTVTDENKITISIDFGSAGVIFLKKLLQFLSKLNVLTKVEIN